MAQGLPRVLVLFPILNLYINQLPNSVLVSLVATSISAVFADMRVELPDIPSSCALLSLSPKWFPHLSGEDITLSSGINHDVHINITPFERHFSHLVSPFAFRQILDGFILFYIHYFCTLLRKGVSSYKEFTFLTVTGFTMLLLFWFMCYFF